MRFEIRTIVGKLEIGETDELLPDCRYSGTIARTVHESDLRTIRVSCAKDYSYLNAAIGSTRMADELLKPLILLTNWNEAD